MSDPTPIPMFLTCPFCGTRHIDEGEFATKVHHTHSCQSCGLTWRPAIAPTVGVAFLPGSKNETPEASEPSAESPASVPYPGRRAIWLAKKGLDALATLAERQRSAMPQALIVDKAAPPAEPVPQRCGWCGAYDNNHHGYHGPDSPLLPPKSEPAGARDALPEGWHIEDGVAHGPENIEVSLPDDQSVRVRFEGRHSSTLNGIPAAVLRALLGGAPRAAGAPDVARALELLRVAVDLELQEAIDKDRVPRWRELALTNVDGILELAGSPPRSKE